MVKPTPLPWKIFIEPGSKDLTIRTQDAKLIAMVYHKNEKSHWPNANLIAAAPRLLIAAKMALVILESEDSDSLIVYELRCAIDATKNGY